MIGSKIGTAMLTAGGAAAEGAPLAVGVVVADPDRHRDVVGEADEPGVVLVVGGAGLAGDVRREAADRPRRAARQHALQHGLELIERSAVDRADRDRRFRIVAIDDEPVALDRCRSRAATAARLRWRSRRRRPRDRSAAPVARRARTGSSARSPCRSALPSPARKVDRGSLPGCLSMPPVEQMHGREIARILQRTAQRQCPARRRRRSSSASSNPGRGCGCRAPIGGSVIGSSLTSVLGCRPLCSAAR